MVAVSGGADSVALLRAMVALRPSHANLPGRLVAAHFNHHLRGESSDADEAWVTGLCRALGLDCEVGHAVLRDRLSPGRNCPEAAARDARYTFLRRAAELRGARYVVTAHTADDQAETILHRILRGTGLAGLAGMARARPLGPAVTLIRPLLGFRRAELAAYLDALGQPYCHDATNDQTRYTRNRIRHELLPQLARQFNPRVTDALLRLGTLAGEAGAVMAKLGAELLEEACTHETDGVRIDAAALAGQPPLLVREALMAAWRARAWPMQAMGRAEWDLLAGLLAPVEDGGALVRKHALPGGVEAESRAGQLRLTRKRPATIQ